MNKRYPGENITHDTRAESHEKVSVSKKVRYNQIISILREGPMTAKEIAVRMMERGFTPTAERNFSGPRLTEMSFLGIVEPVGKKRCQYTGKIVSVYDLTPIKKEQEQHRKEALI